jgi:O-methyltransferase
MTVSLDVRPMYLNLPRNYLTRCGESGLVPVRATNHPVLRRALDLLSRCNPRLVRALAFDQHERNLGLDWPAAAETMIGMQRLTSLQRCGETMITEEVPGDLVECGVWRGGARILMQAVLAVYGDDERCVLLADSFAGVPPPDADNYIADADLRLDLSADVLAGSDADVKADFERHGLLNGLIRFLSGWFKETPPTATIDRISLLRLDGDLYESTIQAIDAPYPRLLPDGFCITDNYHAIEACRQAATDYPGSKGITAEIAEIYGS